MAASGNLKKLTLGLVCAAFVLGAFFLLQRLGDEDGSRGADAAGFIEPASELDDSPIESQRAMERVSAGEISVAAPVRQDTPQLIVAPEIRKPFKRRRDQALVGNAAAFLDAAIQRAEAGDARGAYDAFRLLHACRTTDFDSAATGGSGSQLSGCSEIPEELLQRRLEFLDKAARLGDINAQLDYGAQFSEPFGDAMFLARNLQSFERLKADIHRFVHSAAERGSSEALLQLGNFYEDGVVVREDRIQAFAYYWVADQTGLYPHSGSHLVRLSQGMTHQEALEAARRGQAILERCCR